MNLNTAKALALDLMGQYNLTTTGWVFKFDRAVRRLGLTNYRAKTISLSEPLTLLNPDSQVRNTILHEIAHALVGSMNGHNDVWRSKAISIGCNGHRETNSAVRVKPRYNIVCGVCQATWAVHRRTDMTGSWHKQCGKVSLGKLTYEIAKGE